MHKYHSSLWSILSVRSPLDTTYPLLILNVSAGSRWQQSAENEWSCVLLGRVITLRQDDTHIHYKTLFPSPGALPTPNSSMTPRETPEKDDTASLISYYFNLDVDLTKLYEEWSIADPNFKRKALQFTGIRILRQDAWEALISFICSSNNNIARISQMVYL